MLELQDEVVVTPPSADEKWTGLAGRAFALRSDHVAATNAAAGQVALLHLEITRCQLGPADLEKLYAQTKRLGARAYGLASFVVSPRKEAC